MPEPLKRGACSHLYLFFVLTTCIQNCSLFIFTRHSVVGPFYVCRFISIPTCLNGTDLARKEICTCFIRKVLLLIIKFTAVNFIIRNRLNFFLSLLCESKFTLNNKLFIIFSFSRITHSFGRMQTYKSEFLILFSWIFGEIVGSVWEFFVSCYKLGINVFT